MEGCVAPSEIPGVTASERENFGGLAEDIIFADFVTHYPSYARDVFQDSHNPSGYLFFLASKNPGFTQAQQTAYFEILKETKLLRVPDFLVHTPSERAFYEVKPESVSGKAKGIEKVGVLTALYPTFNLPYVAGTVYTPRDHVVASFGTALKVTLRVRRAAPGLIFYKLCLDSNGMMELATLITILRYVVQQMLKQKDTGKFRPVDLAPAFAANQPLNGLAQTLGLTMAAVGAAAGWKYFWKAVAARFAVRGATAAALALADGPLPVGDLLAAGLAIWTVVDIIRLSDELWRDAGKLAQQGA